MTVDLRRRSVRTLAWLGDAVFEQEVRLRIAACGDHPTDRLDAIKARVVCAQGQAQILEQMLDELDEAEQAVVRRARNTKPPASAKRRNLEVRDYRAATALEALVATWSLSGSSGNARLQTVLGPRLDAAIEDAFGQPRRKR